MQNLLPGAQVSPEYQAVIFKLENMVYEQEEELSQSVAAQAAAQNIANKEAVAAELYREYYASEAAQEWARAQAAQRSVANSSSCELPTSPQTQTFSNAPFKPSERSRTGLTSRTC